MDVEIVKKNGRKFRLSDYGVVKDFVVSSIDREVVRDSVDGRPGSLDYGVTEGDRSINVPFILKAKDLHDYAHLRDELYSLLGDNEPFYIREMRRPKTLQYDFVSFGQSPKWSSQTDNEYVNGKQYLVRLDSTLSPSQEGLRGEVSLEFVTSGLPYAESIYTTKELHDSGYSATAEKYGLVDNINDDYVRYEFVAPTASDDLTDESYKKGSLSTSTGAESTHSDRLISASSIGASPNRGYVFEDTSANPDIRYWNIYEYDSSGNFIKFNTTLGGDGGDYKVRFYNEGRYIKLMAIPAEGVSLSSADIGVKMTPIFRVDSRSNKFSIWNAGNVTVEPEFMDLVIRLNYTYTRTGVSIKNITTGETFTLDADLNGSHVALRGMKVTYGSVNGWRDSNRRFIRIAPGLNEFEVVTDMYEKVSIDFKYYYK